MIIVGLGRISGRIPDIEIIRPVIQYCRIFRLTLLKLSGRISDNLVFYIKQNWHYPAGYPTKPDIRQNRISGPTLLSTILHLHIPTTKGNNLKYLTLSILNLRNCRVTSFWEKNLPASLNICGRVIFFLFLAVTFYSEICSLD